MLIFNLLILNGITLMSNMRDMSIQIMIRWLDLISLCGYMLLIYRYAGHESATLSPLMFSASIKCGHISGDCGNLSLTIGAWKLYKSEKLMLSVNWLHDSQQGHPDEKHDRHVHAKQNWRMDVAFFSNMLQVQSANIQSMQEMQGLTYGRENYQHLEFWDMIVKLCSPHKCYNRRVQCFIARFESINL